MRLPERLEGDGLVLRRWTPEDAEALGHAVTEALEHLRPWMAWAGHEPLTLAERRELLAGWEREWAAGGDVYLGIWVDGRVAGSTGLHRRRGPSTLEIGYWLHPDFTGRGITTTAARLLTGASLALPGIEAVEIHHDRANTASAAVPRRLGFTFVGEAPDHRAAPADTGIDCTWRLARG